MPRRAPDGLHSAFSAELADDALSRVPSQTVLTDVPVRPGIHPTSSYELLLSGMLAPRLGMLFGWHRQAARNRPFQLLMLVLMLHSVLVVQAQ